MARPATVAVLIATFNRAALLGETLDSLARSHMDPAVPWEVVVIDNNSTDGTAAVVRSRQAGFPVPLHYLFEATQGRSAALNAGILATTAPFHTVTALIESLHHDMVCRPGHTWAPAQGGELLDVGEAVRRASAPLYAGPEGALPSDPAWTRPLPALDVVPLPAVGKAAARLAAHRLRSLLPGT